MSKIVIHKSAVAPGHFTNINDFLCVEYAYFTLHGEMYKYVPLSESTLQWAVF